MECIKDPKIMLYIDHKLPHYYDERLAILTIKNWGYLESRKREDLSFEQFYELTNDEVKIKLLFYLDIFK